MTVGRPQPSNASVPLWLRVISYLTLVWSSVAVFIALLEFLHSYMVPRAGDIVWAGGVTFILAPVTIIAIFVAAYAWYRARTVNAVLLKRISLLAATLGMISLLLFPATLSVSHQFRGGDSGSFGGLRTIYTANVTYQATYGLGYAESLESLGSARDGSCAHTSATQACLIDAVLANGVKSGYRFTYQPGPKSEKGEILSYSVHADPIKRGTTGQRSFYLDQTGVIRFEVDKIATADSPQLQ